VLLGLQLSTTAVSSPCCRILGHSAAREWRGYLLPMSWLVEAEAVEEGLAGQALWGKQQQAELLVSSLQETFSLQKRLVRGPEGASAQAARAENLAFAETLDLLRFGSVLKRAASAPVAKKEHPACPVLGVWLRLDSALELWAIHI